MAIEDEKGKQIGDYLQQAKHSIVSPLELRCQRAADYYKLSDDSELYGVY